MSGTTAQKIHIFFRNVLRRFVRIGGTTELQQIRDAIDQHRRFSASGAGQQKKRSLSSEDRFFLHVVQARIMCLDKARSGTYKFIFQFNFIFHSGLF